MVGANHVQPARSAAGDAARRSGATAFNRVILNAARESDAMQFLASPVTGGPVSLDRVSQLFLLAAVEGHPDAPAFAWDILKDQGAQLLKDGQLLETGDENVAELRALYVKFNEKQIPRLAALGVVEIPAGASAKSAAA